MALGDIIICDDDETELLLIERKSLADLAASIKDGRYSEQSYRLNSYSLHNHNIIYLIEGNLSMFGSNYHSNYNRNQRINKKSLQSSILTLLYYKGFSVLRTMSIEETSEMILQMCDKIGREKTKKKRSIAYKIVDNVQKVILVGKYLRIILLLNRNQNQEKSQT